MRTRVHRIVLLAFIQLLFLAACGGGSNGFAGGGSGGSGGSGSGQIIAGPAPNVVTLVVDDGPASSPALNTPYISVTICAPGSTTNCQTIDHVEVDTGSYGLRIISSVLNSGLLAALPMETTPTFGVPIVECTIFGDGFSWGSMRTADLQISGEKAAGIPMQVIGDPAFPNIPTDCSNTGSPENTVDAFGANGVLGVGPFVQDCGDVCANGTTEPVIYYGCATGGGTCGATQVPLSLQASNPVSFFATDNNGVIVELPTVPDAGTLSVTNGALVFGIDTQNNNALGKATVLTTDPVQGYITTTYKNTAYPQSFLDTGSNLNYFNDSSITTCTLGTSSSKFFCPSSELTLTAVNEGANNVQSTVTIQVANAKTQFQNNPSFAAFDNVAAPIFAGQSQSVDFGVPFFYGRNVFTAIEGRNTSGGMGPYVAY